MKKPKHGGIRKGQGLKPKYGEIMVNKTIRFTQTMLAEIATHTNDASEFIRTATRQKLDRIKKK